jgi:hypothetical protein
MHVTALAIVLCTLAATIYARPQNVAYQVAMSWRSNRAAFNYCATHPKSYIALLWPQARAQRKDLAIEALINAYGTIIYTKEFTLDRAQALSFINYVYNHERWFSTPEGARQKHAFCFGNQKKIRAYVFVCSSFEKVLECKYAIRKLFNMGYNSIHITDTHQQTIDLAYAIFTKQSAHVHTH